MARAVVPFDQIADALREQLELTEKLSAAYRQRRVGGDDSCYYLEKALGISSQLAQHLRSAPAGSPFVFDSDSLSPADSLCDRLFRLAYAAEGAAHVAESIIQDRLHNERRRQDALSS